jgi:hypothetical protein
LKDGQIGQRQGFVISHRGHAEATKPDAGSTLHLT